MNNYTKVLVFAFWLCIAQIGLAQMAGFRFASMTNEYGSAFFALKSTTGQLYFMRDAGDTKGVWNAYGRVIRESGSDVLTFALLPRENGNIFYALESKTGQLHWMADFGDNKGAWKSYGQPIRATGEGTLELTAEILDGGTKFTAMDGATGQIYFMFDFGATKGIWKQYGQSVH
jgi:outer membrane protein assembly factor BamB